MYAGDEFVASEECSADGAILDAFDVPLKVALAAHIDAGTA